MHPADRVKSIERAMSGEQTRGQHPNCEQCHQLAAFTLEVDTGSGNVRFRHLCKEDLRKELAKDSDFSAQVLISFIERQLPQQQRGTHQVPLARA